MSGEFVEIRGVRVCQTYFDVPGTIFAKLCHTTRYVLKYFISYRLRGPAVEHRSLVGVLSLSCARPVADG